MNALCVRFVYGVCRRLCMIVCMMFCMSVWRVYDVCVFVCVIGAWPL